jgi:hypothetical protein
MTGTPGHGVRDNCRENPIEEASGLLKNHFTNNRILRTHET